MKTSLINPRRSALKPSKAAPRTARVMADEIDHSIAGLNPGGLMDDAAHLLLEQDFRKREPRTYFSFGDWLKEVGEKEIHRETNRVTRLDPDLIEMRSLSLQAKFQIQRERNYQTEVNNRKNWFERMLMDSNGEPVTIMTPVPASRAGTIH